MCLVSIDSSSRAHFETVRNSCDIGKFCWLSSKHSVGRGTTCTETSAYNTCFRDVLIGGGSAVDASIAAAFCIGVMDAHSAGLGGGHFMVIYNRCTAE